MRGFLLGSLALIAIETLVSRRGPDNAGAALDFLGNAVERFLSPHVAAIPNFAARKAAKPAAAQAPTATGPVNPTAAMFLPRTDVTN